MVGTPQYLAPEVFRANHRDGPARELYALGCVAYRLASGHQVFTGKTSLEVCAAHMSKLPEPPSRHLVVPLPEDFERLILELLAKDPADRPPSAAAMRERLAACQAFGTWTQRQARAWGEAHEAELRDKRPKPESEACAATTLAVDMHWRSEG